MAISPTVNPTVRWHKNSETKPRGSKQPNNNIVNSSEAIVKNAADGIVKQHRVQDAMIGDRPFGKEHVSERQQLRRYSAMRDNAQAWQTIIQQHGLAKAIEYALKMSRLEAKYPEDANFANPNKEDK